MKKLGMLFATVVMIMLFAVSASALEPTGQCGDNAYWAYDSETKELIISGEGKIWDYDYWGDYGKGKSPFMESDIKSVVVENGVTAIGDSSFYYCTGLTNIIIPGSVTSIGRFAFQYCTGLTSIIIPDSVVDIEGGVFENCYNITSITIGKGLKSIESRTFMGCSELEKLVVPKQVEKFCVSAVQGCNNLRRLIIENPECEIEWYVYDYTFNLPKQVILSGYTASTTEQFAYKNNYHFIPLDGENAGIIQNHKYSVDWKTVLPATCTERGLIVKVCNICSDVESKVISPLGHTDKNSDNICDICEVTIFVDETLSQEPNEPETPKEEKNFFEKIIEWFRNFFNNLFGWMK